MNDQYIVTFHFTSGETMDVTYSKDKWLEAVECLKRSWQASMIAGDTWDINFGQVTHYKVKINEEIVR